MVTWQGRLISPQDHRGSASKCWNIATHKEMDGENTGRDVKYCWDTKKLKLWQNICLSTTTTQTPNYTINCCPTAFLFTSTHLLWHTNAVELAYGKQRRVLDPRLSLYIVRVWLCLKATRSGQASMGGFLSTHSLSLLSSLMHWEGRCHPWSLFVWN